MNLGIHKTGQWIWQEHDAPPDPRSFIIMCQIHKRDASHSD